VAAAMKAAATAAAAAAAAAATATAPAATVNRGFQANIYKKCALCASYALGGVRKGDLAFRDQSVRGRGSYPIKNPPKSYL
jgi:hypothetical protein